MKQKGVTVSDFEPAIRVVLAHEGGWSCRPEDPGGATNRGITLGLFRDWAGEDKGPDDLAKLTEDDARAIYRAVFWDRYGYDQITDQGVATKVMDMAVNTGPHRAHWVAQRAVNRVLGPMTLAVDGVLGPHTISGINSCPADAWMAAACDELAQFYLRLIAQNRKLLVFERGWLKRARWPLDERSVA